MGFIDLEKAYDKVNKEALWQVVRMYDSYNCVKVKGGEIERFRIYSGVRQGCIMSPWLYNVYMDGVMKEGRDSWEMGESGDYLASGMQINWF